MSAPAEVGNNNYIKKKDKTSVTFLYRRHVTKENKNSTKAVNPVKKYAGYLSQFGSEIYLYQQKHNNMTSTNKTITNAERTGENEKTENDSGNTATNDLSVAQKVRMERNRQRALLLRSSRLTAHPYAPAKEGGASSGKKVHVGGSRMVDSGGGFFIAEEEQQEEMFLTAADLPQQPGMSVFHKLVYFIYIHNSSYRSSIYFFSYVLVSSYCNFKSGINAKATLQIIA